MATNRSFAYNTGSIIIGTTQIGNLAIGDSLADYGNGLTWWAGPDEDLGYVISSQSGPRTAGGNTITVDGQTVGFWRSSQKTDESFIILCNSIFNQGFETVSAAKVWLNSNGYWTSYVATVTNTAEFYYDPGNNLSYPGTGTTLTNIGTLGNISGTLGTLGGVGYNSNIANGVFNFDGISDKITFNQYNFGNTLTVNAWVYPRTEYSINCLMANAAANTNTLGFKMSWNNWNTTNYTMNFEAGNGTIGATTSTSTNTTVANTWQMVTYVFNKTTPSIKFYKNGVQIATSSGGSPVANIGMNNSNWWMGAIGGNSYYMNANMGEFKIWKSIKSSDDILSEYNSSKSRYGL
jgi:hypothetical protein